MRTYPRSGFQFQRVRKSECTLVPVFVPGEHLASKPPFWKPHFCQPPIIQRCDVSDVFYVFLLRVVHQGESEAPACCDMRFLPENPRKSAIFGQVGQDKAMPHIAMFVRDAMENGASEYFDFGAANFRAQV